jgi:hypothetical protein
MKSKVLFLTGPQDNTKKGKKKKFPKKVTIKFTKETWIRIRIWIQIGIHKEKNCCIRILIKSIRIRNPGIHKTHSRHMSTGKNAGT